MGKMRTATVLLFMGLAGLCGVRADNGPQSSAAAQAEPARESWRKEFDEVCSKTQNAMALSTDALADLIRRCDALFPQIEKLDESQKKVYLGRLKMCRGLYAYVLDSKNQDAKGNDKK
jgi:hypothetical protein